MTARNKQRLVWAGIVAVGLYFGYFMGIRAGAEFALGLYIVDDIHWELTRRFGQVAT